MLCSDLFAQRMLRRSEFLPDSNFTVVMQKSARHEAEIKQILPDLALQVCADIAAGMERSGRPTGMTVACDGFFEPVS
jgi:hypothetical protein